jgi:hypothetical protein
VLELLEQTKKEEREKKLKEDKNLVEKQEDKAGDN